MNIQKEPFYVFRLKEFKNDGAWGYLVEVYSVIKSLVFTQL